jgi:uncharacterized Zn finger protein (UPF0148 family)
MARYRVFTAGSALLKPASAEPLVRFLNDGVVFCMVCQKEITVSTVPRAEIRLEQTNPNEKLEKGKE